MIRIITWQKFAMGMLHYDGSPPSISRYLAHFIPMAVVGPPVLLMPLQPVRLLLWSMALICGARML
jgi:hypothetical protein